MCVVFVCVHAYLDGGAPLPLCGQLLHEHLDKLMVRAHPRGLHSQEHLRHLIPVLGPHTGRHDHAIGLGGDREAQGLHALKQAQHGLPLPCALAG